MTEPVTMPRYFALLDGQIMLEKCHAMPKLYRHTKIYREMKHFQMNVK